MRKITALLFIAISILLLSCNYNKKIEKDFCSNVLLINDSLDQMTNEWLSLLKTDNQKKTLDFSTLSTQRVLLGQFISRNRSLIARLQITQNLGNIRDDENAFLSAQAEAVSEIYTAMEHFNEYTPIDQLNNSLKKVSDNIAHEKSDFDKIKSEIEQFTSLGSTKK